MGDQQRRAIEAPRDALVAQGVYYVATGVAPFVSRRAFERVTGPKREWWLVQTVGVVVTCVGAGLLSAVHGRRESPEIVGLAAGCAAGLAGIDVVHSLRGRISPVYLLDAAVQIGFLARAARPLSRRRAGLTGVPPGLRRPGAWG